MYSQCSTCQTQHEALLKEISLLKAENQSINKTYLALKEETLRLKTLLYGKKSERLEPKSESDQDAKPGAQSESKPEPSKPKTPQPRRKSSRDLRERYPNAPVITIEVAAESTPQCSSCNAQMQDSGLREKSYALHVIPAQYLILEKSRVKYNCCKCYGMETAQNPERIVPGSSYSDAFVLDVALKKYSDLIPIHRYTAMAARGGFKGIPANSLIGLTHYLSDYLVSVQDKIRQDIRQSLVLHADETPHRMLERNGGKKNWYLWGFSNKNAAYFEIHNTRSADVSSKFLSESQCQYLVSDCYTGYEKAVRDANIQRKNQNRPLIEHIYCNAHARRKFKEARDLGLTDADYFLEKYQKIYLLEKIAQDKGDPEEILTVRNEMRQHFEDIYSRGTLLKQGYSSKSAMVRAVNYFINHYEGLTRFLNVPQAPIDNNAQERLLRNSVIGRKTWYGSHSERGANTSATLFSIIESCKLALVNPQKYLEDTIAALHKKHDILTPYQYKLQGLKHEE